MKTFKVFLFALFVCVMQPAVILSQNIVSVFSADKNVIVVLVETPNGVSPPTQSVSSWQVNGSNPSQVGRYSYVYKEEKESGGNYPMSLRHHMYIRLSGNLSNGATYNISTPYGSNQFVFNDQETRCESIHTNQSGYFGNSSVRYANMSIFLGDMGAQTISPLPSYKVLDSGGSTITTGTLTYFGNDASAGGDVYRINLASVPNGGPYRVSVAGYGCSYPFGVGPTFSAENAYVHVRGLYHQRCGIALEEPYTSFTRPACHTTVQVTDAHPYDFITQTSSTTRSISGGYHDAGDFDRRAVHAMVPAWMLNTFEAFPAGFTDNQYNIPESGNGIPDFLDEALWGLKIWEELQEPDGAVRAGTEADRHPTYGEVNAATDNLIYRTYKRWGYTTAMGAGLFAHASRLVQPFNATRASQLLTKAQNAWNYLQAHGSDVDMASAKEGPRMYAAMELYLATGDANYHTAFQTLANTCLNGNIRVDWFNIPQICDEGLILTPYFFGYLITNRPVDQSLKDAWVAKLQGLANNTLNAVNTKSYPIGDNPNYAWGTATCQGRYADPVMLMYRLNGNSSYLDVVSQLADYSLGLNPLGKVYVTGLGVNQPSSPLHLDSYFTEKAGKGPVPGIVIYGPADYSTVPWELVVWEKVHPSFTSLPLQRRFSDGWSFVEEDEFTVWETQAENICMYGFLASVEGGGTPSVPVAPGSLIATTVSSSQINLTWTDNANNETGFKIERKTGSGGTYAQIATVGLNVTSYSNTGLSASTTYFYRVRSSNTAGDSGYSNEANATTQSSTVPAAPSALSANEVSSSQINLSWTDNASNETGFKIERKTGLGGTYAQIATVGANVTTYNSTGLAASITYYYRVRSNNASGDSGYSNETNATTQSASGGTTIYSFTGINQANTNYNSYACDVDVFPFAASSANRNTQIEATDAQYVNISANNTSEWASVNPGTGDEIFLWNSMKINEVASSISQIDLIFNGNTGSSGTIVHNIYVLKAGSDWTQNASWVQVGTSQSITGGVDTEMKRSITTNITTYIDGSGIIVWGVYETTSAQIMHVNYVEMAVTASGVGTAPSAPTSLSATTVSNSQINLSWTDNANNETGFKIERKTGSGGTYAQIATVGANVTTYNNTGLTSSTTYYYRVCSTNASGDSGFSNESNASTQSESSSSYSSIDIGTSTQGSTSDNSGIITVQGSGAEIGGTSDGFRYVYQNNLTGEIEMIARVESFTASNSNALAGLMIRQGIGASDYHYSIYISQGLIITSKYRNNASWSYTGTAGTAGLPIWLKITKSTAPNNIITTYTSNDGVNWTQRWQDWFGSNITEPFTAGLVVTANQNGSLATATFSNITWPNGTTPSTPNIPGTLSANTLSSSQINLSWTDNSNNETGFKIERKTGAGGSYAQIATVGANVTSYNNTGLTAATAYYFRVRATNSTGDSGYSNEANASTFDNPPVAPSALSANEISTSQINLGWVDNANNETGFKIERKTGAGGTYAQIATVGANVTSYNNTGLTAATTYYYRVRATNSTGDSGYSNETNATTQVESTFSYTSLNIGTCSNGVTSENGGVINVSVNSSYYIWGQNDAFRYVYQDNLSGDITLIARVDNLTANYGDTQAGITIRKNTDTNSANYGVFVYANGTIKVTYRSSTGAWSGQDYSGTGSVPKWLKLEKVGTTVTAFTSDNGATWTNVASENMNTALSDNFTAGLAVASGNINYNVSANFSNISLLIDGAKSAFVSSNDINSLQNGFILHQNYPNPFANFTEISYQMAEAGDVEFKIFDISGRIIWTMKNQNQSPGFHSFEWRSENSESKEVLGGVYFYQMKITTSQNSYFEQRKMLIIK